MKQYGNSGQWVHPTFWCMAHGSGAKFIGMHALVEKPHTRYGLSRISGAKNDPMVFSERENGSLVLVLRALTLLQRAIASEGALSLMSHESEQGAVPKWQQAALLHGP